MARRDGGEDSVQILQLQAYESDRGKGETPERLLNFFVRVVAFIERLGNGLGTLAFTWATVILLGGYPTKLSQRADFVYTTAIVFLEAARMFIRSNNKLDYQLFFHTKGAVKPLGWNGLIVIVYLFNALVYLNLLIALLQLSDIFIYLSFILVLVVPSVLGPFQPSLKLLSKTLHSAISLCSPLVAVLMLVPIIMFFGDPGNKMGKWIVFSLLLLAVFILTVSKHRRDTKLAQNAPVDKKVRWHRSILNVCMFVELVLLVFLQDDPINRAGIAGLLVCFLLAISFGNLQIPAAVTRVVLAVLGLVPHDYLSGAPADRGDTINLKPSLDIFYGMVLAQGILYVMACVLEIFSFIPRKCLARHSIFRCKWGVESINAYYKYAMEKSIEGDAFSSKKISLNSFAMYRLNSDTPKMQLDGIRIIHCLLQREQTRTLLLQELNASIDTMAILIRMLDKTRREDTTIRLFAAKVIAEMSKDLRVVTVPAGTMQLISALLDANSKPKTESALLDTDDDDDEQEKKQYRVTESTDIHEQRHASVVDVDDNNLQETQACSSQQVDSDDQNCCSLGCWKWILTCWSSPTEKPLTPYDHLPVLGMSILDSLACDYDNCVEISRVVGLIPKIIGFTSYINGKENTNYVQQKILMESSLKLLRRLSNTGGEIGITLRRKVSEYPILLRNVAEILNDGSSSHELKKLVAGIIRNLAIDRNTSQEIGCIRLIITRLTDAFLNRDVSSSTNSDHFLQKVAGQALTMLTMESSDNCEAFVMERKNFVEELANFISGNKYKYVAARLLQNLFQHIQVKFSKSDLRKLCETLGKVVDNIMDIETDVTELEALIGLSSQTCRVNPEEFTQELKNGHREETFVKSLINTLNANMNPAVHCPGIRRVTIEQAIYLMDYNPYYATLFNKYNMMDALLMVEQTPSSVERYKIFLGDVGFMEHKEPLTNLVSTAKRLMRR